MIDRPDSPSSQETQRLFDDYLAAREAGEASSFAVWVEEHPRHRDALTRLHDEWREFEGFAADVRRDFGLDPFDLPVAVEESAAQHELDRLRDQRHQPRDYDIREEIGHGGMGTVTRVFDRDLRRDLAMKVLRKRRAESGGGSGTAPVTRFLAEAQITGQLEHPGIVPVHEIGVDEAGDPYFTMSLVRGRDLRDVLERTRRGDGEWSQPRVLGVLLRVCETLAYAHSKGVVHRDLKPANIMVGRFGEVYVMDWGLARSRNETSVSSADASVEIQTLRDAKDDASDASRTLDGAILGTPAYMSPEQAGGRVDEVGPRSDVYALGAILYELLTGTPPYVDATSQNSSRQILERILAGPPRSLKECARHAPPELVAICETALAREPADRYGDTEAMADDLRAWLEGRVVRSYESGGWAELRKWVARNRLVAASWLMLLAVLLGAAGSVIAVQWKANGRLEAARASAEEEADVLASVLRWTEGMFTLAGPDRARGRSVTANELIDVAAAELEQGLTDDPRVRGRLAGSLGQFYEGLGSYAESERLLRLAAESLIAEHGTADPRTFDVRSLHALTLFRMGSPLEARAAFEALRQDLEHATDVTPLQEAAVLNHYGSFCFEDDRNHEAEVSFAAIVAFGADGRLRPEDDQVLSARNNLGTLCHKLGRFEEAERLIRDVYETRLRLHGEDHPDTFLSRANLGSILRAGGSYVEARVHLEGAVSMSERVLGSRHAMTIGFLQEVGLLLRMQGELEESERVTRDCAQRAEALAPDDPQRIECRKALAAVLSVTGRWDEARPLFEELLTQARKAVPAGDRTLVRPLQDLARMLQRANPDRSERLFLEALAILRATPDLDPYLRLDVMDGLTRLYVERDEGGKAELIAQEAYDFAHDALGERDRFTIRATVRLGLAHRQQEHDDEAEQYLGEAVELAREHLPPSSEVRWTALYEFADLLHAWDLDDEAEALIDELMEHAAPAYANFRQYQRLHREVKTALGR